ncbi:MAG: cytochrome c [Actinomycetota bacterium]|nr:cytochrome c [Actinomycetota bacterium]
MGVVIIVAAAVLVLAVGVAYGATRARASGRASGSTSVSTPPLTAALVLVYLGVGIIVPVLLVFGNRRSSTIQAGGVKLTAAMQVGRQLFAEHCAVCHTLAAANAVGQVGPNLDNLRPSEALVLRILANGCLQKPVDASSGETCLGYGTMQADIVEGTQAKDVAEFVARVAGHP